MASTAKRCAAATMRDRPGGKLSIRAQLSRACALVTYRWYVTTGLRELLERTTWGPLEITGDQGKRWRWRDQTPHRARPNSTPSATKLHTERDQTPHRKFANRGLSTASRSCYGFRSRGVDFGRAPSVAGASMTLASADRPPPDGRARHRARAWRGTACAPQYTAEGRQASACRPSSFTCSAQLEGALLRQRCDPRPGRVEDDVVLPVGD